MAALTARPGRNWTDGGGVTRSMRPLLNFTAASLVLALAACGQPTESSIGRPAGADELVIRVENRGGLLPPLEKEKQAPSISIYGDGRVLVPAPVPDVFPGPAGYGLETFSITPAVLDEIVSEALAIGLRGADRSIPQQGPDFVVDGGATVITVIGDGSRHETMVDALFDTRPDTPERQSLHDFVSRLFALRDGTGLLGAYEPSGVRLYTAGIDNAEFMSELELVEVAWPLDAPLASWGDALQPDGLTVDVRCGVVEGEDLATVLPVLHAATAATVVVDGDDQRLIAYRPLLPDESTC